MISLVREESRRGFFKTAGKGLAAALWGAAIPGALAWTRRAGGTDLPFPRPESDSGAVAADEGFWRMVRAQFPLTRDRVYFNNGGLGPSPYPVIQAVEEATRRLEVLSETGHEELEAVRQRAAAFLGCLPEEIGFTRNTTEGMNLIARGLPLRAGDEVLMSTHEHVGGAMPWLALMNEKGIRIRLFEPALRAEENLETIERHLTARTRVVSICHMTCTVGTVFPVKEVARLCRERGIWCVIDGAHPPGQMPVDLHDLECDFYATSGHKWLLGPKGTGILYIRRAMHDIWKPPFVGAHSDAAYDLDGLHLEYLREARCVEYGTRNVALVLGLGAAIDFLSMIGMERVEARDRFLAGRLLELLEEVPEVEILTPREERSRCGIVAFRPLRKPTREVLEQLARLGFRVRPVGEHRLDAIRVSCHIYTQRDEVERFAYELRKVVG
jgi:selenocysteine lyase/cysteine desulfurase